MGLLLTLLLVMMILQAASGLTGLLFRDWKEPR